MATLTPAEASELFRTAAIELGFDRVGFAPAGPTERHDHFARWLAAGYGDGLDYLPPTLAARSDPRTLLPSARSVVSVALSYAHSDGIDVPLGRLSRGAIARYARGPDYHTVLKERLNQLGRTVAERLGQPTTWLSAVDTQAILERQWAAAAGLGFIAKNTMLITPSVGSYTVIGEILTDLECEPGVAIAPRCGQCRACLDACPTNAFVDAYTLDARRCLSYLTIENRGPIPRQFRAAVGNWIFGCDICQQVCPFNAGQAAKSGSSLLAPDHDYRAPELVTLLKLGAAQFRKWNRRRAMRRVHRAQLLRNVAVALGNVGTADELPSLIEALRESSPLVREHVVWAIGALARRTNTVAAARTALEHHRQNEQDERVNAELALVEDELRAGA